jgi:hypothetical protein
MELYQIRYFFAASEYLNQTSGHRSTGARDPQIRGLAHVIRRPPAASNSRGTHHPKGARKNYPKALLPGIFNELSLRLKGTKNHEKN